jgi:cellulose synthase/poly-beta-1,6-N-acetylglucosamine synthase-like glycosyltransferase
VPVKNERDAIGACLENLTSQTYPSNKIEVLIVDGMSGDETRNVVENFKRCRSAGNGIPIIEILDNTKGQRASGLNVGISNAKGDVIIRIDARTKVNPDYIEKCVDTLLKTSADNVGGMQVPITTRNGNVRKELTQRAIGMALSHPFGIGNAQFRLGGRSGFVDTVYLGCFRKAIFDRVGLFDEDAPVISEDSDMNYRIRRAGGRVYFNKDIVASYYPRDNFRDLARLYFRYGGAKAGNFLKIKNFTAWRQLVPPLFLVSIIALGFASLFSTWAMFALVFILGTYLLLDIIVSMSLAAKAKQAALFHRLFMAFPMLHFPWAMGFFVRLVQRPRPGSYWGY